MFAGLQPAHLGIVFFLACLLLTAAIISGRAVVRAIHRRKDQP
jgi:hypothetical protein